MQFATMKTAQWAHFEGNLQPNGWTARFDLCPTPLSRTYRVQIDFYTGRAPRVSVVAPDLFTLVGGRKVPHVYGTQQAPAILCLYHPDRGDWMRHMHIADTLVPWTAEWLFYFELWLGGDAWRGGGEHPSGHDRTDYGRRLQERWRRQRLTVTQDAR